MSRLQDFIDFAIQNEIDAAELYERYSNLVKSKPQKELLKSLGSMERSHAQRLRDFHSGAPLVFANAVEASDMQISDYQVDVRLNEYSTLEDVFVFAMKSEQKAYELYTGLANLEEDPHIKMLFHGLAQDEKGHKALLEGEYEKGIMQEN